MSIGILDHGFGVRTDEHVLTEFVERRVDLLIRSARSQWRCAHRGAADVFLDYPTKHGQVQAASSNEFTCAT